ncbi:ubiquitin fusion degradation protein [Microthyrium microscopicum]|uniref:Ubiquitin fusion degradation protein 1 n=1 Tax=Microthyrium microscopicum TaxID=703497 RepID=A0A6A6UAV0_9PEZI|nr:ubiquitin fusion degradation protein [Microthyrium microscopicum]
MYRATDFDPSDPMSMYQAAMRNGRGRNFDEYFRCYPIAMLPGPDRPDANHGGKVFLPPSALDKLTRLHITYPMLFELKNNKVKTQTHAGVLEFIAEEGKIYLPYWLMQTLVLEPGDLVQVQSTDLPLGTFIKLQPQDVSFLDISDPKAVLENAFRNFACLTTGDTFTFSYNDTTYSIAVLETKPENPKNAICTLETDLSVDFAPPIGYEEPSRKTSGTSTPRSMTGGLAGKGGVVHAQGSMAQAINYASIAPSAPGAPVASVHFSGSGNRLAPRKGKAAASRSETPVDTPKSAPPRAVNGPQPLRLGPGKLFFGYAVTPVKKKEDGEAEKESVHFAGSGQTLRKKKGDGKDK